MIELEEGMYVYVPCRVNNIADTEEDDTFMLELLGIEEGEIVSTVDVWLSQSEECVYLWKAADDNFKKKLLECEIAFLDSNYQKQREKLTNQLKENN